MNEMSSSVLNRRLLLQRAACGFGHVALLGLLTSQALVEALGGEFTMLRVSTVGGAMVRFTVPVPPRPRA